MLIAKVIAGIIVFIAILILIVGILVTNIIILLKNESRKEKLIAIFNMIFVIILIIYFIL